MRRFAGFSRGAVAIAVALASVSSGLSGQVPGLPVLQNAFGNPGVAAAANFGGAGAQSFYGLAGSLSLGGGKLQLSGGAGAQSAHGSIRGAYGARASASVWTSIGGSLGVGAFVGAGGAPRTRKDTAVTNPAELSVPAGISFGYRRAIGTTRGLSLFVSPMYRWTRVDSGVVSSAGAMRAAAGVDFALSSSVGLTAGVEMGQGKTAQSTLAGAAVTFVPGRR